MATKASKVLESFGRITALRKELINESSDIKVGDKVKDEDGEYTIIKGSSKTEQLIGKDSEGNEVRLRPNKVQKINESKSKSFTAEEILSVLDRQDFEDFNQEILGPFLRGDEEGDEDKKKEEILKEIEKLFRI
jgi:hypothetical protein